jgi:hypothetical protein
MDHLLDQFFNPSQVASYRKALWQHIRTAAFLESDFQWCDNTGRYKCAHTGRQFANHEVFLQGDQQEFMQRGNMTLEGIDHYVKMRYGNVKQQLAKWRQTFPRGSSGATF